MVINTYLSTIDYKNKWNRNKIIDTEDILMVSRWVKVKGMGEKGQWIKMSNSYRIVIGM